MVKTIKKYIQDNSDVYPFRVYLVSSSGDTPTRTFKVMVNKGYFVDPKSGELVLPTIKEELEDKPLTKIWKNGADTPTLTMEEGQYIYFLITHVQKNYLYLTGLKHRKITAVEIVACADTAEIVEARRGEQTADEYNQLHSFLFFADFTFTMKDHPELEDQYEVLTINTNYTSDIYHLIQGNLVYTL